MESEHVEGIVEPVKKNPEVKYEDGKISLEEKTLEFSSTSSLSSTSSSSCSSSLEFDIGEKGPLDDSSAKSKFDGDLLSGPESPDITAQTPPWSMLSASPPPEFGMHLSEELSTASPDSSMYNAASPMTSPPVQTMGQPAGYDPNRIPASIFSTKATNPSDWSVTSNESLFSIHMGNNSFSRDYAVLFGKSGELPRLSDMSNSQPTPPSVSEAKSSEFRNLPPVIEVPPHEESSIKSGISRLEKGDSNTSLKVAPGECVENHATEKTAPAAATNASDSKGTLFTDPSSSTPRLSDESGNSSRSFAFPVLVSDSAKTGSLSGGTEKPQEPQPQEQDSKETPKPPTSKWSSWFPCLPRCC